MVARMPLVSIITPSYNSERFIRETYESISKQTYQNWEWLVTDDCSSDSTVQILLVLRSNDARIKVFTSDQNRGASESRNNSIRNSKGGFLAFIDSDDLWEPRKLERQLNFMIEKEVSFSFTAYRIIDSDGYNIGRTVDLKAIPVGYKDMLRKKATIGCSTVMLNRGVLGDVMMPALRRGQDYATWLKLLRDGEIAYPLLELLTSYRIVENSLSRNKARKAIQQWRIYRETEGLDFISSFVNFLFYAWRAVFRK